MIGYTFVFVYYLVEDTLDSILGGSDDEAEEDAVISQVLDEIGIEVTGKVSQHSNTVHTYNHGCSVGARCIY